MPFHKRKQRHSVLVTHRRCGKTVASICDLIGKAIKHPPARQGFEGGRFAYIATTYAAGKDIAWEMLKAYCPPVRPGSFPRQSLPPLGVIWPRIAMRRSLNAIRIRRSSGAITDP